MVDKPSKNILVALGLVSLTACADLSMYNQRPAPVGHAGTSPWPSQPVETFPLESEPSYIEQQTVTPDQNPAVLALLDDAKAQQQSGSLDSAVSKLERAVRIDPKDSQVWHQLAGVRYEQRKYQLAISMAKKSLLLAEGDVALRQQNWLLVAESYDRLGEHHQARVARQKAANGE